MKLKKLLCVSACLALLAGSAFANGGQEAAKSGPSASNASSAASSATPAAPFVIPAGQSISQQTDIVAANHADMTTMDPQDTSDTLSGGIQRMMMDGLFGFDDNLKVINLLATGYTANTNATEYTITLRKGVSFTDGTPWNAEALMANLSKWADKKAGLKRTALLCDVLKSWQKIDDYTVKIELNNPFGAFISTLAHPACVMMSPKVLAQGPKACAQHPVGTGQYMFKDWVLGDHITLTLNKNWWGYDPKLCDNGKALVPPDAGFKSITFKPVSEGATRTAMLQAGDAQIEWPLPNESVAVLQKDKSVSVGIAPGLVEWYAFLNTQKKPFNDKRVRQALAYATDVKAYAAVVANGLGQPPDTVIGPQTQFAATETPWPYDINKAKALLTEAGYPKGFSITMTGPQSSNNLKAAQFLQQQWAKVGVTVKIAMLEPAVAHSQLLGATGPADQQADSVFWGWSSSTGDADWAIRPVFASTSIPPHNFNLAYYSNPDVDKLLTQALSTADPDARRAAYKKAQDIIWDDCPVIPCTVAMNAWATSAKITGVKLFADGCINLRAARMGK